MLIPELTFLLEKLKDRINSLAAKYAGNASVSSALRDVDLYISVPQKILDENATPFYEGNVDQVSKILSAVDSLSPLRIPLFSASPKAIDFSQFKVRGHYDDPNYPELADYFQAMIWLGKIEMYLIAPQNVIPPVPFADVQRQLIGAAILSELADDVDIKSIYDKMEMTISVFAGEQDNVNLDNLNELLNNSRFSAADLADSANVAAFQEALKNSPYAEQKILSQILIRDPFAPEKIEPAAAFMLFGQRFVIDSYVLGNVVYDKTKTKRMLPATLDIIFALGNDAAAQLLKDELEQYKYSPQLAALRYLVDAYDESFWQGSIYNEWLNSIRTLNPPADRSALPAFMQTAAWWQQKMNTQLASWTELRHDNLLYAKQSYTGGVGCNYPFGYVEPNPDFFAAMKNLAESAKAKLSAVLNSDFISYNYFDRFASVMDTLATISINELNGTANTDAENKFLRKTFCMKTSAACGEIPFNGWYRELLYDYVEPNDKSVVVADIHTAPTDEFGNTVGWVKHSGTGRIDLILLSADLPGVGNVAFAGPVYSYHEFTTTNFFRISDNEWRRNYLQQSTRPDWVNIYLASTSGESLGEGLTLITDVSDESNNGTLPANYKISIQNYPNPFNPSTNISFTVPSALSNNEVDLSIYSINGEKITTIVRRQLQAGTYISKWDGISKTGAEMPSGVYLYKVSIGNYSASGKMVLEK